MTRFSYGKGKRWWQRLRCEGCGRWLRHHDERKIAACRDCIPF